MSSQPFCPYLFKGCFRLGVCIGDYFACLGVHWVCSPLLFVPPRLREDFSPQWFFLVPCLLAEEEVASSFSRGQGADSKS